VTRFRFVVVRFSCRLLQLNDYYEASKEEETLVYTISNSKRDSSLGKMTQRPLPWPAKQLSNLMRIDAIRQS